MSTQVITITETPAAAAAPATKSKARAKPARSRAKTAGVTDRDASDVESEQDGAGKKETTRKPPLKSADIIAAIMSGSRTTDEMRNLANLRLPDGVVIVDGQPYLMRRNAAGLSEVMNWVNMTLSRSWAEIIPEMEGMILHLRETVATAMQQIDSVATGNDRYFSAHTSMSAETIRHLVISLAGLLDDSRGHLRHPQYSEALRTYQQAAEWLGLTDYARRIREHLDSPEVDDTDTGTEIDRRRPPPTEEPEEEEEQPVKKARKSKKKADEEDAHDKAPAPKKNKTPVPRSKLVASSDPTKPKRASASKGAKAADAKKRNVFDSEDEQDAEISVVPDSGKKKGKSGSTKPKPTSALSAVIGEYEGDDF